MRRMNPILSTLILAISLGCASNVDRHWGEAQHANTEAQIANPVAALRNADKEVGALDGTSAVNANDRLRAQESNKTGKSTLPDFIQIGSGSGSGN